MTWRSSILIMLTLAIGVSLYGYWGATQYPVERRAEVALRDWPQGEPPLRILLIGDIHVADPDMPPSRLERIVEQFNALEPDVVLIAGDFVSDKIVSTRHFNAEDAVAPLSALQSRLGVYAVLGNHEHWRNAAPFRSALADVGVVLLDNEATQLGLIVLIGIDDIHTGNDDAATAFATAEELDGPRLVLSHSPDIVPVLPENVALVVAGHTHCGQVSLPLIGGLVTASRYGERFACGDMTDNGQRVIVGAGLGTSILPIRFGVPPDYWLIELGPTGRSSIRVNAKVSTVSSPPLRMAR